HFQQAIAFVGLDERSNTRRAECGSDGLLDRPPPHALHKLGDAINQLCRVRDPDCWREIYSQLSRMCDRDREVLNCLPILAKTSPPLKTNRSIHRALSARQSPPMLCPAG